MSSSGAIRTGDAVVLIGYLVAMAAIGVYFARKQKTAEGYFVGNRAFPGWAVGLSMFATSISSVTFLAFPGAAFILDWRQVVQNLTLPLIAVLAILVFIPFFRRGQTTSAYEYLEERFGPLLRLYGAINFILLQFVRLGTVLYLVAIPVQILTGTPIIWIIVVVGIVISFYTILGGLEAVIWIDVIQATVLIVGAVLPVFFILFRLPGGLAQVLRVGMEHHKFGVGPMSWDLTERTFPVMMLIGLLNWTTEYTTNQNVIQRYLAASSLREARKATAICAVMSLPIWIFFFFVGTSLFVYYQVFPDSGLDRILAEHRADWIFPYFILSQMPSGIAGLVIAGLLAATMSLDSSINSVAAVTTIDIIKRHISPGRDDAFYLRVGKLASIGTAVAMIAGAIAIAQLPKESMVDLGLKISQIVLGGGLMGLFLLGFLTTRVNYVSASIALGLTILLDIYLALCSFDQLPESISVRVHTYWIGVIANGFTILAGYGISRVLRESKKPLDGLTIWTMSRSLGRDAATSSPCERSQIGMEAGPDGE
jgi:solute:Na+ symporter, SSS family